MAKHRRTEWSDVDAYFGRMGVADGIAIHHTASVPAMQSFDPAYLRALEHGEMARGYNALAYHTMFMLDGDSAESRPYGAMGAATGGHNEHTIAFCVPGYFHEPYYDQSTPQLLRAMAEEIKALKYLGFLTPYPTVRPHTWWTAGTQWATACCGSELIPWVDDVEAMSYDNWSPGAAAPRPKEDVMYVVRNHDTAECVLHTALGTTRPIDKHFAEVLVFCGTPLVDVPGDAFESLELIHYDHHVKFVKEVRGA